MADKNVQVNLNAKNNTKGPIEEASKDIRNFSKTATEAIGVLSGLVVGGVLADFFKSSFEEAAEAQKNFVDLGVALRNVGADANTAAPQVDALVKALAMKTGIDPDQMAAAMNRLIVSVGSYKNAMSALPTVLDVAKARHMELEQAATLVSKAYQGNETALKKLGVQVQENETPFDALRRSYKGFADEEGKTLEGTLGRLKAAWKEDLESMGTIIASNGALSDAVATTMTAFADFAKFLQQNKEAISDFITVAVKLALALGYTVGVAINAAVESWKYLEATVIDATAGWYMVPEGIKLALGLVLDVFAEFAEKSNAFLNFIGIHAADGMVASMKGAASTMIETARTSIEAIHDEAENQKVRIFKTNNNNGPKKDENRNLPKVPVGDSEGQQAKSHGDAEQKAFELQLKGLQALLTIDNQRVSAQNDLNELAKQYADKVAKAKDGSDEQFKAAERLKQINDIITQDDTKHFNESVKNFEVQLTFSDKHESAVAGLVELRGKELELSTKVTATDAQRAEAAARYKQLNDLLINDEKKQFDDRLKGFTAELGLYDKRSSAIKALLVMQATEAKIVADTTKDEVERLKAAERLAAIRNALGGNAKPVPTSFKDGFIQAQDLTESIGELTDRAIDSVGKLDGAFGNLAKGSMQTFFSTMGDGIQKAIAGHQNLAKAIIANARMAVAQSAAASGREAFIDAGKALGHAFLGDPAGFAAAAEFTAAGVAYEALAASLGGSGGSAGGSSGAGSSGGASPSAMQSASSTVSNATTKGPISVTIPNAWDTSNPYAVDQFKQMLATLTDRDVTINLI